MASIAVSQPDAAARNRLLVTASVMLATIMQVLDSTIANVALPHMEASLGAARDTITWVLTSYIVATAIALPITGWLAERIGRKRLFLLSITMFVLASMLCGLAQNLTQMVLFRVMQGVFGAFIVPLGQAIMLDIWPKEKHAKAMAIWGMSVMLAPIMGPVIGGWLTESFDWRWVFFVNLPFGILALAGTAASLRESKLTRRRFDLFGFAMLAIGVTALQLMLDRGEHLDWFESTEILIELAVAVACLWIFGVHVATGRAPLFPLTMVRDRNFVLSLTFMFLISLMVFSTMAIVPPMMQSLYGYPVITAGLVVAPRGGGMFIAMMVAGRLGSRVDPRVLLGGGISLCAMSLYMMRGFSLDMDWTPFALSGVIQGLGFGFIIAPLNVLAFATLPPQMRTDASSFYSLVRNVGSSIGISIATVLLARNLQTSHADLSAQVTIYNAPLLDPTLAQRLGQLGDTALALLDAEVNRQALLIAYLGDFHVQFIGTLCMLPLVVLVRPVPPPAPVRTSGG